MHKETNMLVSIDGNSFHHFDQLLIEQEISNHHRFELVYKLDYFSNNRAGFFDDTKEFIGKEIVVEIRTTDYKGGMSSGKFIGLVTEINFSRSDFELNGNVIHIIGYSPTILLDSGPDCASYISQDLKTVVRKATTGHPENVLKIKIDPRNKQAIPYTVQFNESSFSFIRRLAARHGEWLFFDGEELVFGQKDISTSVLMHGENLMHFDLKTKLQPQQFTFTARDYSKDNDLTITSSDQYSIAKGIPKYVADASASFFTGASNRYWPQPSLENNSNQVLREAAKLHKDSLFGNTVAISGKSVNPSLKVGHVVDVKGKGLNYGSYIVTQLTHRSEASGDYFNTFTAVPFDLITPPDTNVAIMTFSGDQNAVVVDNNDPECLGRVKVRFMWSTSLSPWLRVMTPHAGADKGIYFVPEIGEEVLIGFEGSDVEKPYVKGSLYNGHASASGWGTKTNDVKAIRTKSGHTILFDDAKGGTSITIKDKSGNSIFLNTREKSITIEAPETMTLSARNMYINVEQNLTTKVGKDNKTIVGANNKLTITEKHELSACSVEENITEDMKSTVGGDLDLKTGSAKFKSSEGDFLIKSAGMATLHGKTETRINKG